MREQKDIVVSSSSLSSGNTKSCGCLKKQPDKDLTNQEFGRLTVIGFAYIKNETSYWNCKCSCGNPNIILVRRTGLTSGGTKSCGCYKIEKNSLPRKTNLYEFFDSYGVGNTEGNEKFYFDKDDFPLIQKYYWHLHNGYVHANTNRSYISMHRLVMNVPEELVIDHINHDCSDNRKANLRICTSHQNVCNKIIAKNNKSGKTGVCKEGEKWHSYIFYNGKTIHLGRFNNFEDAVNIRKEAEIEYFEEFANKN